MSTQRHDRGIIMVQNSVLRANQFHHVVLQTGVRYSKKEIISAIRTQAEPLLKEGRLEKCKNFIQHSDISVYQHCCHVAYVSCVLCMKMGIHVSWNEMIRGALLHDYFLYDWHDPSRPAVDFRHAFGHPTLAMRNALADYKLTRKEMQIIQRHMFPLTPIPPTCREGWIIVLADKICTILEVLRKECVRL